MSDIIHSIKYPLSVDSGSGQLAEEWDYSVHIKQLIKQVLLTGRGDRINRPSFGCGLRNKLFAADDYISGSLAQMAIKQALDKWLGSVITIQKIEVNKEDATLFVDIDYQLRTQTGTKTLNMKVAQE